MEAERRSNQEEDKRLARQVVSGGKAADGSALSADRGQGRGSESAAGRSMRVPMGAGIGLDCVCWLIYAMAHFTKDSAR